MVDGSHEGLIASLVKKTARVGVIGLGYVGLPLVRALVEAGYCAWGFDVDASKVECLAAGNSYLASIPAEWVARQRAAGRLEVTADMARLGTPDVLLICVPTPLDQSRDPDLSYVESTARKIAKVLRPGQLIVLESTTYPGTTRDVVIPLLEESGLRAGEDFLVAYSPEREDPGNPRYETSTIPKVVGGINSLSLQAALALYDEVVVTTVPVSSCEVAEACKILENTYRSVNIAMVNELKVLFQRLGIDVWEVIDAARTKPFGFQAFYPGPGLGGHCIPIDPFYLSWLARKNHLHTRFIELAGEVNAEMPRYVVERVAEALNSHRKPICDSRIALLGVAYKPDVADPRESPAFRIFELLSDRGAVLSYHDPLISTLPPMRHYQVPKLSSTPLTPGFLAQQDCVLIVTNHSGIDWDEVVRHAPLVVDTRNATSGVTCGREKIVKA